MPRPELFPHLRPPVFFAHRGVSARFPENTVPAFFAAREEGIAAVELDVRMTLDGVLVVVHDENLLRVSGVDMPILETPFAMLREAYPALPTLDDVIEAVGNEMCFDIEVKPVRLGSTRLQKKLAGRLAAHALRGRVLLSSFDPFALRYFRRAARHIPCATIYANDPAMPRFLRRGQGSRISGATVLKPDFATFMAAGRQPGGGRRRAPVVPWTVNDAVVARALIDRGVAGIISDDPTKLLRELAATGPGF